MNFAHGSVRLRQSITFLCDSQPPFPHRSPMHRLWLLCTFFLLTAKTQAAFVGLFPGFEDLYKDAAFVGIVTLEPAENVTQPHVGPHRFLRIRSEVVFKGPRIDGQMARLADRRLWLPEKQGPPPGDILVPGQRLLVFLTENQFPKARAQWDEINVEGSVLPVSPETDTQALDPKQPSEAFEKIIRDYTRFHKRAHEHARAQEQAIFPRSSHDSPANTKLVKLFLAPKITNKGLLIRLPETLSISAEGKLEFDYEIINLLEDEVFIEMPDAKEERTPVSYATVDGEMGGTGISVIGFPDNTRLLKRLHAGSYVEGKVSYCGCATTKAHFLATGLPPNKAFKKITTTIFINGYFRSDGSNFSESIEVNLPVKPLDGEKPKRD